MKTDAQSIIDTIHGHCRPAAIYLFGSHAEGTISSRSDVDIAVLFDRDYAFDEMKRLSVQQELSDELGKECDLVVLNRSSSILCMQVIRKGQLLDVQNPSTLARFIIMTMSKYVDLKTIRGVIERNILKGKVYGR